MSCDSSQDISERMLRLALGLSVGEESGDRCARLGDLLDEGIAVIPQRPRKARVRRQKPCTKRCTSESSRAGNFQKPAAALPCCPTALLAAGQDSSKVRCQNDSWKELWLSMSRFGSINPDAAGIRGSPKARLTQVRCLNLPSAVMWSLSGSLNSSRNGVCSRPAGPAVSWIARFASWFVSGLESQQRFLHECKGCSQLDWMPKCGDESET
mmetsp:Transcript_70328/g.164774  ORF Transcript_70328/g.164774 Transcript_70328/m.164774 type:complete len:211 (-) Transcript_70328:408-1040(-)